MPQISKPFTTMKPFQKKFLTLSEERTQYFVPCENGNGVEYIFGKSCIADSLNYLLILGRDIVLLSEENKIRTYENWIGFHVFFPPSR